MSCFMGKGTLASCGFRSFKGACAATQKGQKCGSLSEASSSSLYCVKRPRGRAVSAPDFGSRGRGFESRWRRDSSEPKRRFIAQSLSCSPFHRLEMTEILLKGRKTLTHPSHIVWGNSQGSGETARMHRLAWAFAGRICDEYHFLMSRLI